MRSIDGLKPREIYHILNISFDVAKTEGHFVNLPLFGVVTSLTDQSNQTNSTTS